MPYIFIVSYNAHPNATIANIQQLLHNIFRVSDERTNSFRPCTNGTCSRSQDTKHGNFSLRLINAFIHTHNTRGGHLYFNLYIIRIHENEEKGSFFGTRRVSRLGYQKWPK